MRPRVDYWYNVPRVDDGLDAFFTAQHHEQIAHHRRLALFVERHDVLAAQLVQRHLDHADGAFDDLLARGDNRRRLLPPQHRARNFRRVGEVADPRLDDFDTGFRQPLLHFVAHPIGDFAAGRQPQRHLRILMRIVGIRGRQIPHRGLALHVDEVLVVVDVEHRLERLDDAPDDDRGNFDGIAVSLVDLQLGALEIAHPQRQLAPRRQAG